MREFDTSNWKKETWRDFLKKGLLSREKEARKTIRSKGVLSSRGCGHASRGDTAK